MSTWSDVATVCAQFLTTIWNGIFGVTIFDGLTFKGLIGGLFAVCFVIWLIRYFVDNTHPQIQSETKPVHMGTYKDYQRNNPRYHASFFGIKHK